MKFGYDYRKLRATSPLGFIGADNYGNFDFTGAFTGSDFADFLLGIPASTSYAIVFQDNDGGAQHYALFGQDSFQVGRNVTLEYGLRWEYHPAYTDASGNIGNFDPSVARSDASSIRPAKRTCSRPAISRRSTPAPRPMRTARPARPSSRHRKRACPSRCARCRAA
jgi:outer membrane receptor protein involved in Fe transport